MNQRHPFLPQLAPQQHSSMQLSHQQSGQQQSFHRQKQQFFNQQMRAYETAMLQNQQDSLLNNQMMMMMMMNRVQGPRPHNLPHNLMTRLSPDVQNDKMFNYNPPMTMNTPMLNNKLNNQGKASSVFPSVPTSYLTQTLTSQSNMVMSSSTNMYSGQQNIHSDCNANFGPVMPCMSMKPVYSGSLVQRLSRDGNFNQSDTENNPLNSSSLTVQQTQITSKPVPNRQVSRNNSQDTLLMRHLQRNNREDFEESILNDSEEHCKKLDKKIKREEHDVNLDTDICDAPFLGSAEDLDLITRSLMDGKSFHEILASSPLVDIAASGFINSPMSVESTKTNSSTESMKDVNKLRSLSLVSPDGTKSLKSEGKPSPLHSPLGFASGSTSNFPTKSPRHIPSVNRQSSRDETDHVSNAVETKYSSFDTKQNMAITDAMSTLANDIPQNVSPFENINSFNIAHLMADTDLLKELNHPYPSMDMSAILHRSLSAPLLESSHNFEKRSSKMRRSDGDPKISQRKTNARVSRTKDKPNLSGSVSTTKSAFSLLPADTKEEQSITQTTVSRKRRVLSASAAMPSRRNSSTLDGLYYENKTFYKLRQYLRELTSLQSETSRKYPTLGKQTPKSAKLFLNQLTSPHVDDWVLSSITSGVKNDKEINMKNMTKRKITVYTDIPQEHIDEFSEQSGTEPFRYLSDDYNGKSKPSEKLMNILAVTSKKQESVKKEEM